MEKIEWISGKKYKELTGEDDAAFANSDMLPLTSINPVAVDWRLYHNTKHKKIAEQFGADEAPTYEELLKSLGVDADSLQTLCETDGVPSPNYFDLLRMYLAKKL